MFYISVKMADMAALKSKNKRMKKRDYSLFLIPLVLLLFAKMVICPTFLGNGGFIEVTLIAREH